MAQTPENEIELTRNTAPALERVVFRPRFTDEEKDKLIVDGAKFFLLRGLTILAQWRVQTEQGKPSFQHVADVGDRLLAVAPSPIEMAIYPDPQRFFIPDTFDKALADQERLVAADAQQLRARTGLQAVSEVIAEEAATWTDIIFQHLEKTDVWLFGPEYAEAQSKYWVFTRTKNPTNRDGSYVAEVGYTRPSYDASINDMSRKGLSIYDFPSDIGHDRVGASRLVVPLETR